MYIEDVLRETGAIDNEIRRKKLSTWQINFLEDIYDRYSAGRLKALSSKQINIMVQIFEKIYAELDPMFHTGILRRILNNPQTRLLRYDSFDIPSEVRYLGDDMLGFRFKMNPKIKEDIKEAIGYNDKEETGYNDYYKIWIIKVNSHNLDKVTNIIRDHEFHFDDTVVEFLVEISNDKLSPFTFEVKDAYIIADIRNNKFMKFWLSNILYASIEGRKYKFPFTVGACRHLHKLFSSNIEVVLDPLISETAIKNTLTGNTLTDEITQHIIDFDFRGVLNYSKLPIVLNAIIQAMKYKGIETSYICSPEYDTPLFHIHMKEFPEIKIIKAEELINHTKDLVILLEPSVFHPDFCNMIQFYLDKVLIISLNDAKFHLQYLYPNIDINKTSINIKLPFERKKMSMAYYHLSQKLGE